MTQFQILILHNILLWSIITKELLWKESKNEFEKQKAGKLYV